MKAKDYAAKLKAEEYSKESINWLINSFAKDIVSLAEARNVKTHKAYMNVIKQQYEKWKAISRKTNGMLKPDAFFNMLELIGGDNGKKLSSIARQELK